MYTEHAQVRLHTPKETLTARYRLPSFLSQFDVVEVADQVGHSQGTAPVGFCFQFLHTAPGGRHCCHPNGPLWSPMAPRWFHHLGSSRSFHSEWWYGFGSPMFRWVVGCRCSTFSGGGVSLSLSLPSPLSLSLSLSLSIRRALTLNPKLQTLNPKPL